MVPLSLFLAWRYIRGARKTTIGTMLTICFISIFLSTAALTLVTFIMQGFEQTTHATLKGMHADIIMQANGQHIDFPSVQKVIAQEFPEIAGVSPSDTQQGLIQSHHTRSPSIVMIKGIDPHCENQTSSLETMLDSTKTLPELLNKPGSLLIGHKLADALGVTRNSSVQLLVSDDQSIKKNSIHFHSHNLTITTTFKTGIEELDTGLVVCSLSLLEELLPDTGVSTIHLKCTQNYNQQLIPRLKKRFRLNVYSWKDLYPALVEALVLEKYSMIIVLSLMVVIASMSIISLLFMLITAKQTDQAILQAMGFSRESCLAIFIIIGLIVSMSAALAGIILAIVIGLILQKYPLITLPEAYFVKQLPIIIEPYILGNIALFIFIVSVLGSFLALQKSTRLSIAQLLRGS